MLSNFDFRPIAKVLIILIVFFAIYFVYVLFRSNSSQINMDFTKSNVSDMTNIGGVDDNIEYYVRGDRDRTTSNNMKYTLIDSRLEPNIPCGPQTSWDVEYQPGYNGTYSDLLWHKVEPKMILENNSLYCNKSGQVVSPKPANS